MTDQDQEQTDQPVAGDAKQIETEQEGTEQGSDEPETFPRAYVEQLRQEAAKHRQRASDRDALAAALWEARVAATGRLADPTDLAMPADADPLDGDALAAALDALLARKPHLGSRRPAGDIGQGATQTAETVDLAGMLRARA